MKNYLFAPFKDDEEKIEEFNHFKNYLSSGHRNSLIMFIGRLESYYDAIIEELKADKKLVHAHDVDDLLGERNAEYYELLGKYEELKAENYHDEIKDLHKERDDLFKACKLLKADNKELKAELRTQKKEHLRSSKDRIDMIKELKAEYEKIKATNESLNGALITKQATIDTLKADYDNDIKASYDLDDKHVEIIKRLETEKDALLVANGELLQSNLKLRGE